MEKCFEGFAEMGFHGTGIRTLSKYSGYNSAVFYASFKNLNDLIIQSTEY